MKDVKDLISKSAQLLESKSCLDDKKSNSLYPVALVYMGDNAIRNGAVLKSTLNANWANARDFIQELCLLRKSDGTFTCFDLSGENNVGTFAEKYDACIKKMLEAPDGVFLDKSRIKVEFIISTDEAYFPYYIKEVSSIDNYLGLTFWKSLFVMMNQSNRNSQVLAKKSIDFLWKYKDMFFRKNIFTTMFFLSNYLTDKSLLSDDNLSLNYRLAGDIILLGANADDTLEFRRNILYGAEYRIKTASYTLVEKPSPEIAMATLLNIIDRILFVESDQLSDRNFETLSALGISMGKINFIEDYFAEKIKSQLPQKDDFKYLPFNKKLFRQCRHDFRSHHRFVPEKLTEATYGVWDSFYSYNCRGLVEEVDIEEFRQNFKQDLLEKFTFNEFIALFGNADVCEAIDKRTTAVATNSRDIFGKMADTVSNMVRNDLYERLSAAYKQTISELHAAADSFKNNLLEIRRDIARKNVVRSGIYDSINDFYSDKVVNYINYNMKFVNKYINIFSSKEEILDKLYEIFEKLTAEEAVYSMPFEKELSSRLENAGHAGKREQIIRDALVDNINSKIRLNTTTHLKPIWQSYLGNVGTDFINSLKQTIDSDVSFFDLSRSDGLENIQLFSIDDSGDIAI